MHDFEGRTQLERDMHIGKIMWVCNVALGYKFFRSQYISVVGKYMENNKSVSIEQLLKENNCMDIISMMK